MKKLLTSTAVALTLASAAATGAFAQTAPASPYIDGIENAVRASDFIGKRVYITGNDTTGLGSGSYADADSGWEDAGLEVAHFSMENTAHICVEINNCVIWSRLGDVPQATLSRVMR